MAVKIRAKADELSHTSSASGLGGTYGSSGKYHPSNISKAESRPPSNTSTTSTGQGQGLGHEPTSISPQAPTALTDKDSGIFDLSTPLSDTGEIAVRN